MKFMLRETFKKKMGEVIKLTSGNPVLDKNLECIEKYNPQLKEKLLNLPYLTNQIDLIETELQEPNLSYNGLPLHDPKGAEAEAKELFGRAEDELNCINVILGMGLGHLFKEFAENTQGSVVIYEPNLEILRVTLELVDFSKELSQVNVKIASNIQELKQTIESVYKYKSEVNFLYLNSYRHINDEGEIQSMLNQVQIIKGICSEQYNMVRAKGLRFISAVLSNLAYSIEATPLLEFKDRYKGKTAIIVSAGPTLDANIESIKKNRNKIIIFCVGTAFKALADNGIHTDFLNVLEMDDCSGQVKGFDLSDVNLILEPFVSTSFQTFKVKQKYLYPSITTTGSQYWSHITGVDISKYISGGTVSFEALECAKMLGFTRLILVGQDLAYVNNQIYSSKGSYGDITFEMNPETNRPEFKIRDRQKYIESCSSVDSSLTPEEVEKFADEKLTGFIKTSCFVKGITGGMIPTCAAYALFVDLFREFACHNEDLELINTSMVGAQLDGFKNMTLDQALKDVATVEEIELKSNFEYNKNLILENLTKDVEFLEGILEHFEESKGYFYKFERDYQRNQAITNSSYKYINLLLKIYDYLTLEYFNEVHLYRVIAINESLELKYYADRKKENDDIKIKNLFNFLKIYFIGVEDKIKNLIGELNQQKEILRKGMESESLEKKNKKEKAKGALC